MCLSFILQSLLGASPLQAFSAGAALCSTSLGTTFTILGTSGLSTTRLGVVLTSAAMMDDVVGLIMVQVISNLGGDSFDTVTVVRPVMVSIAFGALIPVACRFFIKPVTLKLNDFREKHPGSKLDNIFKYRQTAFLVQTLWLLGLIIGGTFAGTSSLLAAYLAGASVSWWDSDVPHVEFGSSSDDERTANGTSGNMTSETTEPRAPTMNTKLRTTPINTGIEVYEHYYKASVEHILKPFFFVSDDNHSQTWTLLISYSLPSAFPYLLQPCSLGLLFGVDLSTPR